MMNKVRRWLPIVIFVFFLASMATMTLVRTPQHYSEREKRVLSDPPALTADTLFSGDFGRAVETYLADHFALRDFYVGVNAYYQLLLGRNGVSGAYRGSDGFLMGTPPVALAADIQKKAARITRLAETTRRPVSVVLIPSPGVALADHLPWIHDEYPDESVVQWLTDALPAEIPCLYVRDAVQEETESKYYRTDHHLTSAGAHAVYAAYAASLGLSAEATYTVEQVDGFYGAMYARAGLWGIAPDVLELWSNARIENARVAIPEADIADHGIFFREHLETADPYNVFLDGNHGVTIVTGGEPSGEVLLVVRDSYAHCIAPFMLEHFSQLVLVDLRYYRAGITPLMETYGVDRILFLYGMTNFPTDDNFVWLR